MRRQDRAFRYRNTSYGMADRSITVGFAMGSPETNSGRSRKLCNQRRITTRKLRRLRIRASVLRTWSVVAAVGLAAPATAHDPKSAASSTAALSPQAREAAAIVDAFHAALRSGDTTAAAALLASDALIYESGSVEQGKAEYASHHLSADAAFSKATQSVVTQRSGQANGNLAWIATESTTKGSYKKRPIKSVGTETMILRHDGQSWRIVHVHWSLANVK